MTTYLSLIIVDDKKFDTLKKEKIRDYITVKILTITVEWVE